MLSPVLHHGSAKDGDLSRRGDHRHSVQGQLKARGSARG
ncbi:hypothetical protein V6Z11_D01G217900 [Gossypium hirsutum]